MNGSVITWISYMADESRNILFLKCIHLIRIHDMYDGNRSIIHTQTQRDWHPSIRSKRLVNRTIQLFPLRMSIGGCGSQWDEKNRDHNMEINSLKIRFNNFSI